MNALDAGNATHNYNYLVSTMLVDKLYVSAVQDKLLLVLQNPFIYFNATYTRLILNCYLYCNE